jgi:hypothetical protein
MQRKLIAAVAILTAAGTVSAVPTLDGTRDAFYGPALWVQNQPTAFGDNRPDRVPPPGNPGNVTKGVEFKIPLSALGNPSASNIRISGFVNSGNQDFLSNQVIGGLPALQGNLGDPRNVNFQNITTPANQWAALNPSTVATAPTVNGDRDAIYGAPKFTQTTFTEFGDATHGQRFFGSGSEIDAVYAVINGSDLYVLVTGNLEANFNKLNLFFDTDGAGTAGQNRLESSNPPVDDGRLLRMSDDGTGNGLTFDTSFDADYWISLSGGNIAVDPDPPAYALFAHFAELPTGGGGLGYYLGTGDGNGAADLTGGDVGAPAVRVAIDNSNIIGVPGTPPFSIPSPDFSVGSELDNLHARVAGGKLYVFIGGNLETNFNKLSLFVDVGLNPGRDNDPGQNVLRADNVNLDFDGLNRMGGTNPPRPEGPGLTFDSSFSADYFLGVGNGGISPVQNFFNAAVLRADGPLKDFSQTFNLDYGSFDGGPKATNNPLSFNGDRLDEPGVNVNIFSNYAPRSAQLSFPLPPANDLVRASINNSNIAGVNDTSADGAAAVSTGIELEFDLAELGWDGSADIKIAGFISNGGYSFLSNQVIGGLPGPANLGESRAVNFGSLAGNQFVKVRLCPADFNNDNTVDFFDYLDFVAAFDAEDPSADFNGDNTVDFFDYLDFVQFFDECSA